LRSDQHRIEAKRTALWIKILKIDETAVKSEFATLCQQAVKLPADIKSMIDVDINRSFNLMPGITGSNLRKILTSYAVCNPELNYCQGMNFIAGFLYLLFKDEALSFAVLRDLIHRYNMGRLFNTELPMLKLNFY
jgi:ecotropic viral integration site 5 protein